MATSLSGLNKIMAVFGNRIVRNSSKLTRETALQIDAILVGPPQQGGTPVDTGRARSNWLTSLGKPRTGTVEVGGAPNPRSTIAQRKPGQVIFITNNLPYIQRLNEGSSSQAPANFVEMAVMEGERVIRKGRLLKK